MGRKKQYDRDALIESAVNIFHEHGFAGTSTQMLVDGLGVNRFSLYAEFGSKQELFDATLQCFEKEVIDRNFGPLESPDAGLDQIRALFAFYGSAEAGWIRGRGCLICNTAVEFGPNDPSGKAFVQRYFKRLSRAFQKALANAQARGELRDSVDPEEEAAFFTASILGLFVMLRAEAPAPMIESASRVAIEHLEALSADSSTSSSP